MFEFITDLGTVGMFLILIIFILFILVVRKGLGIIKNVIIILIASVLFPIVLNLFFQYPIPLNTETIFSFAFVGVGLYILYLIGKTIYKILTATEKAAMAPVKAMKKRRDEHLKKKMKDHIETERDGKKEVKEQERMEQVYEEEELQKEEERDMERKKMIKEMGRPKKEEHYEDYVDLGKVSVKKETMVKDVDKIGEKKIKVRKSPLIKDVDKIAVVPVKKTRTEKKAKKNVEKKRKKKKTKFVEPIPEIKSL